MQTNRAIIIKKRPIIVLDGTFPVAKQLNVGDKGQLLFTGLIEGERKEFQEDDVEHFIKTVRMLKFEIINQREARQ